MSPARPDRIIRLAAADVPRVVDVLAEAFYHYPVMRFVLGPAGAYDRRLRTLVDLFVQARALRDEPMFGIGSDTILGAVAIVSYPHRGAVPAALAELREAVWRDLGADARARYDTCGTVWASLARTEPNVHVNMIGVRRAQQGRGLARRLLGHVHDLSARTPESAGVTLTTEDPANVPLYQHLGYSVHGHAEIAPGLETWSLFRPNPAGHGTPADFANTYADEARAEAYAGLEFPGTYYLAFRDIPAITAAHVTGTAALDFGCGTGRSTRFLRGLGYETVGVDIADEMLRRARAADPAGEYLRVADGSLDALAGRSFDLVFSAFTFDNVPTREKKVALLRGLAALLRPAGRLVNLVSSPDIYTHEWASFSTRDFPENRAARAGDVVRIVMLDVPDRRPVEDVVWPDAAYRDVYAAAGLEVAAWYRPLGRTDEPQPWVSETAVAPWSIYVLRRREP